MICSLFSCKPKRNEVASKKTSIQSQKLDTIFTKNLSFKQFASKDGLPSSQIWNTYQDKYGYLWVATNDGVARFDGYNFYPYFNDLKRNIFLKKASGFFEDSDGDFWVISGEGCLNKFDRNNDKFIYIKTPLENGWSEQSPHQIYEDSLKNFWIGAYGGFQYYDRNKDTVLSYPIQKIRNQEWPHAEKLRFGAFFADKKGNIWAGTRKFGFVKFNTKTKQYHLYRTDPAYENLCFVDWITDIIQLDERTLIISEFDVGMIFWDIEQEKIIKIVRLEELLKIPNKIDIRDMYLENDHVLWLGTDNNGLMSYDLKTNKIIEQYQKEGTQDFSISANRIRHINKDREGNFWLASNTLEIANPNFYKFKEWVNEPLNPNSLIQNNIYSLFPTKDGKIMASTRTGLSILNPVTQSFDNSYRTNIDANRAFGVLDAKDSTYWVGHYDKIANYDPKTKKNINEYSSSMVLDEHENNLRIALRVMEDSRGVIWTINQWGRLNYIDKKNNKLGTIFDLAQDQATQKFITVLSMVDDPEHQQIIVGTDMGLVTVSYINNNVSRKRLIYNDLDLSNLVVSYLYRDKSKQFWAIIEGRTYQLNSNNFDLKLFDLASIYGVESFKWIVEEPKGILWLSCYKGIIKYDIVSQKSSLYFSSNIGDYTTDSPSPVAQLDDKIFFGGNKGLTMIETSRLIESDSKPIVNIESVNYSIKKSYQKIKDTTQLLYGTKELELDYYQNKLILKYVGLRFENPENMNYAYKLEGYDKGWVQVGKGREAIYTNLSPKTYIFNVKAIANNNQWYIATLKIIIRPPFWLTWWALLFYVALASAIVYFYITYRVKRKLLKIKELEAIRLRISSNLHDDVGTILSGLAMQSQMMALTSEISLKESLLQLSDMSHDAMERMRDTVWAIDSRKDKYENLIDRMRVFAEKNLNLRQIKHSFRVEIEDSKKFINPEKRQNIYLIFKEAITNICKHANATDVNIYLKQEKNNLFLLIHDNGTEQPKLNSDGSGMNNMRMRAKNIGADISFIFQKGYKIELTMSSIEEKAFAFFG